MNVLVVLGIILFILMSIIGGQKGVSSFFALFFNFSVVIIITVFMTNPNINPIILTLFASIVISCINLFYINGVNIKTKTAFLSTMITIILLLLFILYLSNKAMVQGFGVEELEELSMFSLISVLILLKLEPL